MSAPNSESASYGKTATGAYRILAVDDQGRLELAPATVAALANELAGRLAGSLAAIMASANARLAADLKTPKKR